jgi:hypothetical protein
VAQASDSLASGTVKGNLMQNQQRRQTLRSFPRLKIDRLGSIEKGDQATPKCRLKKRAFFPRPDEIFIPPVGWLRGLDNPHETP